MERKLVAILAADVVGYSRLMNADEAGTLTSLRAQQKHQIQPSVTEHGGRVVKTMGDGVLIEFGSVVQAVQCAVELQRGINRSNADLPPESRMQLRIGINLGDVIVEDGDIFGEGVNIATRLEQLAEPGGICISGSTYDQVRHKLDVGYLDLGEQQVKNIPDPIHAYQVDIGPPGASRNRPGNSRRAAPERDGGGRKPYRFGIIVLPFDFLSAAEDRDYFCDGLTSDITTDLSRFSNLFVIAANTALTYKGRPTRIEEIGRTLNVDYVLEGSVQQLGERIRINAQLIDATTGHHLWAQRFDRRQGDLFAVQDEIVRLIVTALSVQLTSAEYERAARKHPASFNAYEAYLHGSHLSYLIRTNDDLATCRSWFEQAIALDPLYARAWGALAYVIVKQWLEGRREDGALRLAETHARKAVELDPNDYLTHSFLAFCCLNARVFDSAINEYERALALNPNDADLLVDYAEALIYVGRHQEAVEHIKRAMELNPHTPDWYRWDLGWGLYFTRDYAQSVAALRRILDPIPDVRLLIAAGLARLEKPAEVAAEMTRFRESRPDWSAETELHSVRFRDKADEEHWLSGVRLAGLPETLPAPAATGSKADRGESSRKAAAPGIAGEPSPRA